MNKQLAIKLNTEIIRYSKSPHERDLARMRINILKKALKRKKGERAMKKIKRRNIVVYNDYIYSYGSHGMRSFI